MLARDIQGIQHGFLAGRHLYYCGGKTNAYWKVTENETLGFTHPMFRDGRARGYGIVTDAQSGTGHDKWGWKFWRDTRVAYGTVIIGDKRYPSPIPQTMIWRRDRQICRYTVAGVTIEETKFINVDDVLCAIIQASGPIHIEFEGQSCFKEGNLPTFDGDPAGGLKQGKHALRIEYFQSQKRQTLQLFCQTPSVDRTEFSPEQFWHTRQGN